MSTVFGADATCPGCGERVRRAGLSAHRKTQHCVATTAIRDFHRRGWTTVGYRLRETLALGIPTARAKTQRNGSGRSNAVWAPDWVDLVLNNWPGREGARGEADLLDRFCRRLVGDPEVLRAFNALRQMWSDTETTVTADAVVAFARAACNDEAADVEVRSALEALHRALIRRSYG